MVIMTGTRVCALIALVMCASGVCEAGCADRQTPRCCPGRNNECTERSPRRTVCYCDTYCRRSGDCCDDYHTVCHISAIDCEVRQKTGVENGLCVFVLCSASSLEEFNLLSFIILISSSSSEVAKILSDSFKRNFKDPWRRPHMLMKEEKKSYCVQMRVKQASAACKVKPWSAGMVRERSICVECQSEAMTTDNRCRGDGLQNIRTFWSAASAPGCSGSWVRESFTEDCQCPSYSLIFI
ncbi:somatomedin-B and thrombospondin type-1 domain-containing protein [Garra rufa]|uniref:somatomedin-B and thrombospondin type-1 domain-containing protein n=1 Tax=Garra rufa TaxID=137080 RepID=UPI003CCE62BD